MDISRDIFKTLHTNSFIPRANSINFSHQERKDDNKYITVVQMY